MKKCLVLLLAVLIVAGIFTGYFLQDLKDLVGILKKAVYVFGTDRVVETPNEEKGADDIVETPDATADTGNVEDEVETPVEDTPGNVDTENADEPAEEEWVNIGNIQKYIAMPIVKGAYPEFATATSEIDVSDPSHFKHYTGLDSSNGIARACYTEYWEGYEKETYLIIVAKVRDANSAERIAKSMIKGIGSKKEFKSADDIRAAVSGDIIVVFALDDAYAEYCNGEKIISVFKDCVKRKVEVVTK